MKKILIILLILTSLVFIFYLSFPDSGFLIPPKGSLQSSEPADIETPFRRAYFTDMSREDVMDHYINEFKKNEVLGISLPFFRLNYPPEEAQTLIRDQTRSTFLEELGEPLRESFYINGFEPKEAKDTIVVEGKQWRQKITVRYQTSNKYIRVIMGFIVIGSVLFLYKETKVLIKDVKKGS